MKLAEERGLGLKSMRRSAESAGLPLPQYAWEDPYLILTLYRIPEAAITSLPADVQNVLTEVERAGWRWLTTRGSTTSPVYAEAMKVDPRTGQRHLSCFVELGLVQKTGSGRATVYKILTGT